ncbi:DHH family phosphoesterase [Candidatus Woesearchaeota archaeon]|nr:DHH family phosphoesterase [Candidatus Woesearchaeota archaeon]
MRSAHKTLPLKQVREIREQLTQCHKPLFFFHGDPDGLCSFLLFYRFIHEGKGVVVNTTPVIDETFVRKVQEYNPDCIFILDIAVVEEEFLEKVHVPVYWIDHHAVLERKQVHYYNPRKQHPEDNTCISKICYDVVQQDLWIAVCGVISDWQMHLTPSFSQQYPDLLPDGIHQPDQALFSTPVGELIRVLAFMLKGRTHDVYQAIKIMTRIEDPYEILRQTTSQGKYLFKRAKKIQESYDAQLQQIKASATQDEVLLYSYDDDEVSLTKELSNEALYMYPDKVIIIGREKDDELKCSVRASHYILPPLITAALHGLQGRGGGHEHACGVVVKKQDFDIFLTQFREELKRAKLTQKQH